MYRHNVEPQRLRRNRRSRTGNGVHSKSLKRGKSERKIIELIKKYQRPTSFNHAPFTVKEKTHAQQELGVTLPKEYVAFLDRYGHGGLDGFEILDIGLDGSNIFLEATLEYRKHGLPKNLVVIENRDEWLECLDCDNGEVVSWSMNSDIVPTAPIFDDFLLDEIENAIDNM